MARALLLLALLTGCAAHRIQAPDYAETATDADPGVLELGQEHALLLPPLHLEVFGQSAAPPGSLSLTSLNMNAGPLIMDRFSNFDADGNGIITMVGSLATGGDYIQTNSDAEILNNGSSLGVYVNDAEGLCVGDGTGTQSIPSSCDGKLISNTPGSVLSVYPNALLTAITMGGARVSQAYTVTGLTKYVSVASTATAANTVWTVSDGTNTCTITFPCNTTGVGGTQDTGTKFVAAANGAGTGCVYAANANLTLAVTTQGCATAATVKNATVLGKWQ